MKGDVDQCDGVPGSRDSNGAVGGVFNFKIGQGGKQIAMTFVQIK